MLTATSLLFFGLLSLNVAHAEKAKYNNVPYGLQPGQIWAGQYQCVMMDVWMLLHIEAASEAGVTAAFHFLYPTTATHGSFLVSGPWDSSDARMVTMKPGEWLHDPGDVQRVGLRGKMLLNGDTMRGLVLHPHCGTFEVNRTVIDAQWAVASGLGKKSKSRAQLDKLHNSIQDFLRMHRPDARGLPKDAGTGASGSSSTLTPPTPPTAQRKEKEPTENLASLKVSQLRRQLDELGVNYRGVVEKTELIQLLKDARKGGAVNQASEATTQVLSQQLVQQFRSAISKAQYTQAYHYWIDLQSYPKAARQQVVSEVVGELLGSKENSKQYLHILRSLAVFAEVPEVRLSMASLLQSKNPKLVQQAEDSLWQLFHRSANAQLDKALEVGIAFMQQDQMKEAAREFDKVVQAGPWFAEGFNKRATVRHLMGQHRLAIEDCEKVLQLNPQHFGALSGAGKCAEALGEKALAIAFYERAIAVHPGLEHLAQHLKELQEA